jgi:predicted AAA+ superfamily ATPase
LAESLHVFGAVSIEGPKYCGKTWSALNQANSAVYVMDPNRGFATKALAIEDPYRLLDGTAPLLIDEWQEAPGIWDAVRFEVDKDTARGRFILTGSTTPQADAPLHSGAGRIARIFLRPMSLYESGDSSGEVSLAALLSESWQGEASSAVNDENLAHLCVRGGWPENIDAAQEKAGRMPFQYLETLYASDISSPDNVRRDPFKVQALVRALARNNATMVGNKSLKWEVSEGLGSISAPTLASYINALKRIFVLEEVPGWAPDIRTRSRVRVSPKRYLVDPSLVLASLNVSAQALLTDRATFGSVFEGLCLRDLRVYSQVSEIGMLHYHDEDDLEVDAILQQRDGSYAAVEIKLSESQADEAAAMLTKFTNKMSNQGRKPPSQLLVLTGGGKAIRRDDGVLQIPITCLRD